MIFYKCLKWQFYQSRKTFTVWGLDSGSFRSWQQLQGQRGQMENLKTCSKSSFICSIHNSNSPVVVWQRLARRPCGFPAADIPLFPVQTSPCIGPFLPASKLSGNFCLVWESIVVQYNWSKDVMSKVDHSSISVSGFWFHTYNVCHTASIVWKECCPKNVTQETNYRCTISPCPSPELTSLWRVTLVANNGDMSKSKTSGCLH